MSGRKVHLVGIGGVGMAGLALLLKARGWEVSGCDIHRSPRTEWLESEGISVAIGHDAAHVEGMDEVIVTPAVHPDAPEYRAAQTASHVRYRGEVLAELVSGCEAIAVCGSHGKTTTATWIARLLLALGEKVSWCIGGETGAFPVAGVAAGGVLVVEADESDGTLAQYHATTLVVNKLDYDHPDFFKTEADYFACFETAKRQAREVIESERLATDELKSDLLLSLPEHNRKNARAAYEVALRRGHSSAAILAALMTIVGELPDRRFQLIGRPGHAVYTDYAHHPTEMACAVQMARAITKGKLRVLFQPHRHSRTKALLKDFPAAFAGADEVVLCPTYAAFEPAVEGGDIADLYLACRTTRIPSGTPNTSCRVYLAESCEDAWEHARNSATEADLTLLLGAGDIIQLVPRIVENQVPRPPRTIWIGAGSNTWVSDLKLECEYRKTTGPAGVLGATLVKRYPALCPWMAGIPGTIGGWIKMNAGAFGHSFSEVLRRVKVDGKWLTKEACGFAYRHSEIEGEIQDFELEESLLSAPAEQTAADYLRRRKAFPLGTYGSFFKNPVGDFAGRLLEEAGAKELKVGGAYVWSEHANVIVRGAEATNSDVLALARLMRNRVWFKFGVELEPEVCGIAMERL